MSGSDRCVAPGQPPLPSRLVTGLLILKHLHDLSDEVLCARWLENPYYQFFCGEESFQHVLPFERSSLTRWRQRLGEAQLSALLQESLSVAHKTDALATKDLERVVVDTTVQPKNVAFPTDARLMHKAIVMLGREARNHSVPLRQSYVRVAKRAALMAGHYAHAKQFKRHNRELRFLRTRLGRASRDIRRKIDGDEALKEIFAVPLSRAGQVRRQRQRPRALRIRVQGERGDLGHPAQGWSVRASPRSPGPRVVSSCFTPKLCTAVHTTATHSARSSPRCKS
jgi:IS5 family transposase